MCESNQWINDLPAVRHWIRYQIDEKNCKNDASQRIRKHNRLTDGQATRHSFLIKTYSTYQILQRFIFFHLIIFLVGLSPALQEECGKRWVSWLFFGCLLFILDCEDWDWASTRKRCWQCGKSLKIIQPISSCNILLCYIFKYFSFTSPCHFPFKYITATSSPIHLFSHRRKHSYKSIVAGTLGARIHVRLAFFFDVSLHAFIVDGAFRYRLESTLACMLLAHSVHVWRIYRDCNPPNKKEFIKEHTGKRALESVAEGTINNEGKEADVEKESEANMYPCSKRACYNWFVGVFAPMQEVHWWWGSSNIFEWYKEM